MKKLAYLVTTIIALSLCFVVVGCQQKEQKDPTIYENRKLDSDLFMAKDIQAFYDKVDTTYGFNLTKNLAQNPEIADYLLFRTAGSDGEHKAADYLETEMNNIGLQNIEKIGVPCDKFQLNSTSLKMLNTDIEFHPGAYFQSGTKGDLTAEIVDCKKGHRQDYEGLDMNGKIALVQIDVYDDAWINGYIQEAKLRGAVALVTWSISGYAEGSRDDAAMIDTCCEDIMPTASISANQANQIKKAISDGNKICTLNVDCILAPNEGTTYNVVGMIPGKNHENRILFGGHYDKYWEGFQDDSAAIGLVFTIAKAMIDSGYVPENDLYFICHGAEEWGKLDSQCDWATGSWELCESRPEFYTDTLALFNCELPAFEREKPITISAAPEYRSFVKDMLDKKILVTTKQTKLSMKINPLSTKEDGISYRYHGVPYFFGSLNADQWVNDNYHCMTDNESTYDEATFHTSINWYGAFSIYIDKCPANPLDIAGASDELKDNFDKEHAIRSGVNAEEYQKALNNLESAGEEMNRKIKLCNESYNQAYKNNDTERMAALREEGKLLNKKTHEAYKMVIDNFLKIEEDNAYYAHEFADTNLEIIDKTQNYLDNKVWMEDDVNGLHTYLLLLNTRNNYYYYIFSKAVGDYQVHSFENEHYKSKYQAQWCWQKLDKRVELGDLTIALIDAKSISDVDLNYVQLELENGMQQCYEQIKEESEKEIAAMNEIANSLNS